MDDLAGRVPPVPLHARIRMGHTMTTTVHVPGMFGLPLALRLHATSERTKKRHLAEEIRERIVETQRKCRYGRTDINGWVKLGEPIEPELIALCFSPCDFGARVTVTQADDGSATFQCVIFGSD